MWFAVFLMCFLCVCLFVGFVLMCCAVFFFSVCMCVYTNVVLCCCALVCCCVVYCGVVCCGLFSVRMRNLPGISVYVI